jgi:outer membrane protein assembly factor BamB
MHTVAFGFLLLVGQTDSVAPEDIWPQWRGPAGNSVAPGKGLPTRWSKTENVIWQTPLPGWGNSTPAIWNDAVFVTTQDEDRLLLLHLDRRSGKVVWQREVGKGTPRRKGPVGNGRFHDEQNMATPSPVTDGRHVWAHFGTGILACYDFAGKQIWTLNMAERYGPYTIWWGHANSPVLAGNLLISVCIQDPKGGGNSYVVAHDKLTGKEKWFAERHTEAKEEPADSYTTPLLFQSKGRTEVIVFGGNVLDAYDPATGKQIWRCAAFKGNRVISGPTLAGDTVYAVQGMKGPLFAIKAGGAGDVTETAVRWKFTAVNKTPDASSPLVVGGLLFMVNNAGLAFCVDAETGQELWKKERMGDAYRATPLAAGGRIYFFSKDGKATIVEAARAYQEVSQADLGEEIIASPAVAGGNLFLRTKGHLYRVGAPRR